MAPMHNGCFGAFTLKTSCRGGAIPSYYLFRGIYSIDLYRSPLEPFVVVYSGGLLPTLHSCLILLLGKRVWTKPTAKFLHVSERVRCFER
jgi:hypothetical protein